MNIVSLASLQFLCLIVLAIMQLLYLRRFIARKNLWLIKLLDQPNLQTNI